MIDIAARDTFIRREWPMYQTPLCYKWTRTKQEPQNIA